MQLSVKKCKEENMKFIRHLNKINILNLIVCFCVLSIAICKSESQKQTPGCSLPVSDRYIFEYKYSSEGDIIIGGIFTVHGFVNLLDKNVKNRVLYCEHVFHREYRHIRAFIFAINQVNKDLDFLPNITLGYHLYDPCAYENKVVKDVFQILSGHKELIPNYKCMKRGKVFGFIGDLNSFTTIPMAQLLNVYGYSQISYGARDPALSNRLIYPRFFRTIYNDQIQNLVIAKLLKQFGWNWVGIISSSDESGERELQQLRRQLTDYGICTEFAFQIAHNKDKTNLDKNIIESSTAEIIILCGTNNVDFIHHIHKITKLISNKTFIIPASWSNKPEISLPNKWGSPINCSLVFTLPQWTVSGMQDFLDNVMSPNLVYDPILEDIWVRQYRCRTTNEKKNYLFSIISKSPLRNCTSEKNVEHYLHFTKDTFPHQVYIAVHSMAQALHDMLYVNKNGIRNTIKINEYALHTYIKMFSYEDDFGNTHSYNEKGELSTLLYLDNWITVKKGHYFVLQSIHIGKYFESGPDDDIEPGKIHWRKGRVPQGQCSESCYDGYRKAAKEGYHTCCYDCVACSVGEISNKSETENCVKCSDIEWPNYARNHCIPKEQECLSYDTDIIVSVFSVTTVLFTVLTVFIVGIFVLFWNNQIVKANNRNLSFLLLISLKLSLLCVFLFLGCPSHITCMLRQITFGIIFTIVLSSVLAKTIMVCIAFKATRPGSYWRKWLGVKLPNYLVLVCSSVQGFNGVIWLSVSPPFQECNKYSIPSIIIIQCNEGSVLAFYFMLGYMGFLAAVSFLLAFMVRTLPDIFNEAKYITFSMLVFCSVWICAIPAYLSSYGKNTVIVEVFAVLASCIGILGCIFFPKCYNILMRPELSRKELLLVK